MAATDMGLVEDKCPVCKKKFFYKSEYVYTVLIKGRRKHVCSWACVMKWEHKGANKNDKR